MPAKVTETYTESEYRESRKGAAPPPHRDAVRALLDVFEGGDLNTRQTAAIHKVRVTLGDAEGLGCPHENTAFENGPVGDILICQDCREELPVPVPDAGG